MVSSCSAFGCKNRKIVSRPHLKFHSFPKDPERRLKWIQAVRRANFNPISSTKICSDHFVPSDYKDESIYLTRALLKEEAVPSVFLKKSRKCDQCDFETIYVSHLKQHFDTIHGKRKDFSCGKCPYISGKKSNLDNWRDLEKHKQTVHEIEYKQEILKSNNSPYKNISYDQPELANDFPHPNITKKVISFLQPGVVSESKIDVPSSEPRIKEDITEADPLSYDNNSSKNYLTPEYGVDHHLSNKPHDVAVAVHSHSEKSQVIIQGDTTELDRIKVKIEEHEDIAKDRKPVSNTEARTAMECLNRFLLEKYLNDDVKEDDLKVHFQYKSIVLSKII